MTKTNGIEELLAERVPSLAGLHDALTTILNSTADAAEATARVRYLSVELLLTAQAASEALTGNASPIYAADFIRGSAGTERTDQRPI